jgi:hypothetical protein
MGGFNNEHDLVSLLGFNGRENAPEEDRGRTETGHTVSNYQPHFAQDDIKKIIDNLLLDNSI